MGISKKKMSSCKRDNYLTTVRDFYGFTSVGKTIYSLFFAIVGSYFLGSYFAACQVLIFILGVGLRIKYPVQR
ncbi:hypothetical protein [Vibrio cholerae]|uniref:hypothetical protein n=1 Tax=Vibrio cholerae TaxID=666 RepID=UPI0011DE464A|nr:hypothetical protein [Vibrio cholerae]GIB04588.1 hypothetical protein VCSRO136_3646 [Vibrio cholerae]